MRACVTDFPLLKSVASGSDPLRRILALDARHPWRAARCPNGQASDGQVRRISRSYHGKIIDLPRGFSTRNCVKC